MSDQYYRFYPGDYHRDTQDLSLIEHGAYRILLDHYYCEKKLPSDPGRLYRICRAQTEEEQKAVDYIIERFFIKVNDLLLSNKRADKEIQLRQEFLDEQVRRSAKRWENEPEKQEYGHKYRRSQRLSEARKKGKHTSKEWKNLCESLGNKCLKCGTIGVFLVKDHITPIYKGGSDGIENIQPLCEKCNSAKGPENIDYRPRNWKDLAKTPPGTPPGTPPIKSHLPSPSPSPSPKKKEKAFLSIAEKIYENYPRKGARTDAIRNICTLLKNGVTPEELTQAQENYIDHLKRKPTDPEFVIQANNFFGRKARWKDWVQPDLTPEDQALRDFERRQAELHGKKKKGG